MLVNNKFHIQVKKAIDQERKRNTLAILKDYKRLSKEYSINVADIPNNNSSHMWDQKNFQTDFSKINNAIAHERLRIVKDMLPTINKSILNIGFGPGNLENIFLVKNNSLIGIDWNGVDISSKSVLNAKNKFPQYNFILSKVENLNYSSNRFDVVIALEVLEHISPKDILNVYKTIKNILKPGGMFIISIPINENLENMLSQGDNPNAHTRIYSQELISAELNLNKFKIISIKKLYAFKYLYYIKNFIIKIFPFFRKPNNLILVSINEK